MIQVSPAQPKTVSALDGVYCTTDTSCTAVGYTEESGTPHAIMVQITKGVIDAADGSHGVEPQRDHVHA